MKYLKATLQWLSVSGLNARGAFQLRGEWRKVSDVLLQAGQAYFTPAVTIGKSKPYAGVYLAFAHDQQSDEDWVIVSDEPTNLQT